MSKKNSLKEDNNNRKTNSVIGEFNSKTLLNNKDLKSNLNDQDSQIKLTKMKNTNSKKYKDEYLLINSNYNQEQENNQISVKNPNNVSNFNLIQIEKHIDLKEKSKKKS